METNLAPVTKLVLETTNLESSEKETGKTTLGEAVRLGYQKMIFSLVKSTPNKKEFKTVFCSEELPNPIDLDDLKFLRLGNEETLNSLLKRNPFDKRHPSLLTLNRFFNYESDLIRLEEDKISFCGCLETVKPVQEESSLAWESGKENMQIASRVFQNRAVRKGMNTVRDLMENRSIIKLANSNDNNSSTIFHLETTAKLTQISIVESDVKNCPHPVHLSFSSQLLPQSPVVLNPTSNTISRRLVENSLKMDKTRAIFYLSKQYNDSPAMHNDADADADPPVEEGLQNISNTLTIVSVLIATVSFTAGIYASSGVHQEGITSRKSSLGRTTAYMVFLVCNNVAFFSSLGITAALISGISFSRKSMIKLLAVMQKIMWVSLSFMVAAYIAAAFMI